MGKRRVFVCGIILGNLDLGISFKLTKEYLVDFENTLVIIKQVGFLTITYVGMFLGRKLF